MKSLITISLCFVSVLAPWAAFGQAGNKPKNNPGGSGPFGSDVLDPFGGSPPSSDPFGQSEDPFGGSPASSNPFGQSEDPFGGGPAFGSGGNPAANQNASAGASGGMGQSGSNPRPGWRFSVQEEKTPKGKGEVTQYTATRKKMFRYVLGSLKVSEYQADMGGGMGGYGGGGFEGGMGGSYGGGGYGESGGYGGMSGMGGMSGYGGGMGMGYGGGDMAGGSEGMDAPQPEPGIMIFAYIFDDSRTEPNNAVGEPAQRTKVELVVAVGDKSMSEMYGMEMGSGGLGMGSDMGSGMGSGMGMGGGAMRNAPKYVRLQSLIQPLGVDGKKNRTQLTEAELTIVSDSIRQSIWKEDAVKDIHTHMADPKQLADTEALLKSILIEEYDTQLTRQGIEIARVEERITKLRDEVARRRAAKDRVIDVQLGRIVLEAQGLLGK